ncbi:major capsid protein [Microbacterium sp. UBA3394]|uniref:major capsid protein n=1 Tax=Microbacterium sp. UBA3394 TaxID=1946945 RepID=UPI000C3968F5|nr:phage capsid protein [Microbacterium sp. UBA3394]MAM53546.1 phage capsid protein [Microbacterium sp.]HAS31751.1 phage capsid protein [Microbacterium sp.]|tara:strand:+ start:10119 stop:11120 length:1002 start_codon:yes stop_codon:yes gene_type:complete
MPISLAEGKNNAQTDLDVAVIDEFRKTGVIPDSLIFDDAVNPAGGGATLTYGYRRLITQATAATRAINSEYTPQNVTTQHYTTDLAVLGGAFEIDRVVAKLGPNASGGVALNIAQKVKSTNAKFADLVINGDTATDANGFDGLDKALTGSSTEMNASVVTDWTDFDTNARAEHVALDLIDEFLSLLDGAPTVIVGNARALARVRAAARRAGMYTKNPVEGLVGSDGRPIEREMYGGIMFADAGAKAGSNDPIIPIETRTVGESTTGLTDLYAYRVALDGFHGVSTVGGQIAQTWLPDFTTAGAVKKGEVELGPVSVALKATKAAAVLRNLKVA